MNPIIFFVPTFLKAISDNTEQSFRSIISEPSPDILVFQMFQPDFCELLLSEVLYHFNYLVCGIGNISSFESIVASECLYTY